MPDEWVVYAIRCDHPDDVVRKSREVTPGSWVPRWATEAAEAEVLIYVGVSPPGKNRVVDHFQGEGALFTQIFPPNEVVEVERWGEAEQKALSAEVALASRLRGEYGREVAYVYQN